MIVICGNWKISHEARDKRKWIRKLSLKRRVSCASHLICPSAATFSWKWVSNMATTQVRSDVEEFRPSWAHDKLLRGIPSNLWHWQWNGIANMLAVPRPLSAGISFKIKLSRRQQQLKGNTSCRVLASVHTTSLYPVKTVENCDKVISALKNPFGSFINASENY